MIIEVDERKVLDDIIERAIKKYNNLVRIKMDNLESSGGVPLINTSINLTSVMACCDEYDRIEKAIRMIEWFLDNEKDDTE